MKRARELIPSGNANPSYKAREGDVELGHKLGALRGTYGLNQSQVAKEVGISRTLLASIEMGHTMPTLKAAITLAAFYEASLDELTAHLRPA